MLKLELAQLKEAVTVLSQKKKQVQTTMADTYVSIAAQKAGCEKKSRNGTGAMCHSAQQVSSEGTVPTSSEKFVSGTRRLGGPK